MFAKLTRGVAGLLCALLAPGFASTAWAECSDLEHQVRGGETIFQIAETYYSDQRKWSAIYYSNQAVLGQGSMFEIPAGTALTIPCLPGLALADPKPLLQDDAEMRLVTGSNYAPFTDTNWPGAGMATELVNAALESTPYPVPFSITWENDWSKHLFPMLDSKDFDMGFPWYQPDCKADPGNERCANFHFSEPLVEVLILLFTNKGTDTKFTQDADVIGQTLCRPAGYFTHDLDREGRSWLRDGKITLVQPATPAECFTALQDGKVDAVALNEFTGWTTIHDMGLQDSIIAQKQPLSVEGLHVLISKRHWRGTTHLYRFNAGLKALKETKRYDQIVSKHLGEFWTRIN